MSPGAKETKPEASSRAPGPGEPTRPGPTGPGWSWRFAVLAGGAVGTLMRWALGQLPDVAGFPVGTLSANVLGALALGALAGWLTRGASQKLPAAEMRWTPISGGLLGASTTFATFIIEVADLWPKTPVTALSYVAVSLALGFTAAAVGRRTVAGART
ncbi:MAG: CrcB protein [Glaciecola sp.]|jgi:CrcB protein